jgi:hypothetical protein
MAMVIDRRCMRARRACSTYLDRLYAALLLTALAACRESSPVPSKAQGGIGALAPSTVPDPNDLANGTKAPLGSAGGPSAPVPVLSASTSELLVASCSPCRFSAGPGVDYEIRFEPPAKDQELQRIEVTRVGSGAPDRHPAELLSVENGWSPSDQFVLRALDLNFDGVLDLGFGPVLGTPNLTLSYWVQSSTGAGWVSLGLLANLTLAPAARELMTREKGGHAGMLWQENTYRWQGAKLVLSRSVEQVEVAGKAEYRRLTRSFTDGKQTSEKSEVVAAPPVDD